MAITLINCPACGNKVSSQATSCPKCGQPISPELHLKKDLKNNYSFPATASSAVSMDRGVVTTIAIVIICIILGKNFPSLYDGYYSNDLSAILWCLFGLLSYLAIWGELIYRAVTRNEIGKILLLIFIPLIGVVLSSFLTSAENDDSSQNKN